VSGPTQAFDVAGAFLHFCQLPEETVAFWMASASARYCVR
jgi:hypothetical protein